MLYIVQQQLSRTSEVMIMFGAVLILSCVYLSGRFRLILWHRENQRKQELVENKFKDVFLKTAGYRLLQEITIGLQKETYGCCSAAFLAMGVAYLYDGFSTPGYSIWWQLVLPALVYEAIKRILRKIIFFPKQSKIDIVRLNKKDSNRRTALVKLRLSGVINTLP